MNVKFILSILFETSIFGGLLYLFFNVIPWGGWVSWLGVVFIALLYLVVLVITLVLWVVLSHADDINDYFSNLFHTLLEVLKESYERANSLFGWGK